MGYVALTTIRFKRMPSKTLHGVTLWAVPRFHRSGIAANAAESGTEWVNRLKTYSFTLGEDETAKPPAAGRPDPQEICH